jgi:hypothetical protein
MITRMIDFRFMIITPIIHRIFTDRTCMMSSQRECSASASLVVAPSRVTPCQPAGIDFVMEGTTLSLPQSQHGREDDDNS